MQQTATFHGRNWSLRFSADLIDVTPRSEPDPNWRYTDSAGHVHTYEPVKVNGGERLTTPTLIWHSEMSCYEDGEEYDAGWYVCLECGERVNPGHRAPLFPVFAKGQDWLEGECVTNAVKPFGVLADVDLSTLLPDAGVSGPAVIYEATQVTGQPCSVRFRSVGKFDVDWDKLRSYAAGEGTVLVKVQ